MIHRKLAPENHPFKESPLSLCLRGCGCSMAYPDMTLLQRPLYATWFLAMALAPPRLANALAEELLYRKRGGGIARKLRSAAARRPWNQSS